MTEQENTEITNRAITTFLVEKGYFDQYNQWCKDKIAEYEKLKKNKKTKKAIK